MTTAAPSTALATIQPAFTDPERLALAGLPAGTLFPARVGVRAADYADRGEADRTPLHSWLRMPGIRQWRRGRSRTFAAIAPAATSGAGRTAW